MKSAAIMKTNMTINIAAITGVTQTPPLFLPIMIHTISAAWRPRKTKKLGISGLMPLFCELDEVMITLQHGVLHRRQTLADGGEYCDYYITGDKE